MSDFSWFIIMAPHEQTTDTLITRASFSTVRESVYALTEANLLQLARAAQMGLQYMQWRVAQASGAPFTTWNAVVNLSPSVAHAWLSQSACQVVRMKPSPYFRTNVLLPGHDEASVLCVAHRLVRLLQQMHHNQCTPKVDHARACYPPATRQAEGLRESLEGDKLALQAALQHIPTMGLADVEGDLQALQTRFYGLATYGLDGMFAKVSRRRTTRLACCAQCFAYSAEAVYGLCVGCVRECGSSVQFTCAYPYNLP